MWKSFILLLLLLATRPAVAQEAATAYEALRIIGAKNRDVVNHVIAVTGVGGDPQPETWKILLDDSRARGGVRELEVSDGRIVSERAPSRSIVGTREGATIDTSRLNLDSSGAYTVASHTAERSHTQFATASYTLRTDQRGEPVWIVTLQNRSGKPVGTIHIGANRGTVTRTEGMFNGTTMDEAVEDTREGEVEYEARSGENPIVARAREMFYRARDSARTTFKRVRRNFADFIRGEE